VSAFQAHFFTTDLKIKKLGIFLLFLFIGANKNTRTLKSMIKLKHTHIKKHDEIHEK
jgi:hypothetical protein